MARKALKQSNEVWKDIEGYEGVYQISSFGRVKSLQRTIVYKSGKCCILKEKILKAQNVQGYRCVFLYRDNISKQYRVNQLVAKAFIPNPNNYSEVNHKDEDKTNNCADNLEWCTHKYNCNYGTRNDRLREYRLGIRHTDKTKLFMSQQRKGAGNGMFGKHHTQKSRDLIRRKVLDYYARKDSVE